MIFFYFLGRPPDGSVSVGKLSERIKARSIEHDLFNSIYPINDPL